MFSPLFYHIPHHESAKVGMNPFPAHTFYAKSRKTPTDQHLLIITVIIIAIAEIILGLVTRQYMMLVAVNAPLLTAIPLFRQKEE